MNEQNGEGTIARLLTSGAFGVGVVLVLLPSLMLFFGAPSLSRSLVFGLPLMAIFGIMILFGSLALVALLFKNLGLTDPKQALGLPEGSIRAAIALALIVLFAIISIMLFRTTPGEPFVVTGLTQEQRNELLIKSGEQVIGSVEACTPAPCPAEALRFSVTLRPGIARETSDLAKQLLILVGTLMTSVTSYYFASRSVAQARDDSDKPAGTAPAADASLAEAHVDGCDVAITQPTADADLPAARGGVAGPST